MEAWVSMLHLLAQPQEESQLTSKQKTPRTAIKLNYKSNNQGFKEATFIQIAGEVEMGSQSSEDTVWHGEVAACTECPVPHSRVVDKNRKGYLRS